MAIITDYNLCFSYPWENTNIEVVPGGTVTKSFIILYAQSGTNSCGRVAGTDEEPGIVGPLPYPDYSLAEDYVWASSDPDVTVTHVLEPLPYEGAYQLNVTVTSTNKELVPPKTGITWGIRYTATGSTLLDTTMIGVLSVNISVAKFFEDIGFFSYPHPDGYFFDAESRLSAGDLVDFTLSGNYPYRLILAGRLSQAAIACRAQGTTLPVTNSNIKVTYADSYVGFHSENLVQYSINGTSSWFATHGDPLCASHTTVTAATTTGITVGSTGSPTVVDNVTLVNGDRVLVKNQENPAKNGIYVVVSAVAGNWTRYTAVSMSNASVYVEYRAGATNSQTSWTTPVISPLVLETTDINWRASHASDILMTGHYGAGINGDYYPLELTTYNTYPCSSKVVNGNPTTTNVVSLWGDIVTHTSGLTWESPEFSLGTYPFIKSVIFTDGTYLDASDHTYEVWVNDGSNSIVTAYPSVANDASWAPGVSRSSIVDMEVSTNGTTWTPLTNTSNYTYSLIQPPLTTIPIHTYAGDDYYAATLTFTPLVAGSYYLRTKPTADANLNVRSSASQTVIVTARPKPVVTATFSPTNPNPLTNLSATATLSVTCSTTDNFVVHMVKPVPYAPATTDNIELVGVVGGSGFLSTAPHDTTPAYTTSHSYTINIPAYIAGKNTTQTFTNVFTVVVTSGSLTYTFNVGPWTYTRPNANLQVLGATSINLSPDACNAGNTKSIPMSVQCSNILAGTVVNVTPSGSGSLTVSPSSFTVPATPSVYSQPITVTFTQPGTPISANISGCFITATYDAVSVQSGTFQVVACGSTALPVLSYYGAGDKGLLFFGGGYTPSISPLDYVNSTPVGDSSTYAYFKLRVGGLPDTSTVYVVQASFTSNFSVIEASVTGEANYTGQSDAFNSAPTLYLNIQRHADPYGAYGAEELAISVAAVGTPATAPTTIYIRAYPFSTGNYSNTITVIPLPTPVIAPPSGSLLRANTTLYVEAGAGMLLCPVSAIVPPTPGVVYFGTTAPTVFNLVGSSGLFQTGTREIVATTPLGTEKRYVWWELIGTTPGSGHYIDVTYTHPVSGSVLLSRMSCVIVAKASNVNLSFADGNTVTNITKGATVTPTANTAVLPTSYEIVKVKSTGAFYTPSGALSFQVSASETASAIYEAIFSTSPDPKTTVDATGVTNVAIKGLVDAGTGCNLTSTTPLILVPAVLGTCYPPYIPELNGLKLPQQVTLTGASTPSTVVSWDFGPSTTGANTLNIPADTKRLGYPYTAPTGLRFEIVSDGGFFKLRSYLNGNLASGGLATPLTISMDLRATISGGCVSFPYSLTVSSEACTSPSLTDLSSSTPVYSCDVFNRANPDSPSLGGNGYETSISGLVLHSFIEDGFAVTPSTLASNYGISIPNGTTKIVTGTANTYFPAKHYEGSASANYSLFATFITNNGVATCTRKPYKLQYYKTYSPKSSWLPIPDKFYLGTSSTSYTYIPALYNNDVLSVQLQAGISSTIAGKLPTDYRLVFIPINAPTAAEVSVAVSYTAGAVGGYPERRVAFTVPAGGGGLLTNVSYIVSIVHSSTECAYSMYDPAVSQTVGTVKYMGEAPSTSGVTFTPVPALDPCFLNVTVTATVVSGLGNVKTVSLFEVGDLNNPIGGWTTLTAVPASANSFYFILPRNGTAFPTTRTSAISKKFKVKLYNESGSSLLATPAELTLSLKEPVFSISESNTNREPAVGTSTNTFINNLTVASKNSTCCSSCSSGTCVADDLSSASISWSLTDAPTWIEVDGLATTPVLKLWNNTTIPSEATHIVQGVASVIYYNLTWIIPFSYSLTPTEAFIIGNSVIPETYNGASLYTATISVSNKPVSSCNTLTWTIVDRQVSGPRPLPDAVTLSPHVSDSSAGVFSWLAVADAGATFPTTYTFSVRAACNGGNPAATPVKTITLRVEPSNPSIYSVNPHVGYFDITNDSVTIVGRNFDSSPIVRFGNLAATSVVVSGDGETITCIPPTVADIGGPDLTVDVIVENTDSGTDTFLEGYRYERQRAPIYLGISPSSGTPLGGTKVLISGANFEPSSVVTIDDVEQPILAITPSSLLFVTYPHSIGEVDVVVSNSTCGGTLSQCPSTKYTFRVSPQILTVTPFNISASGNDPLFIVGTGFYETGTTKPRVLVDNFEIPSSLIVYRAI